MSDATCHPLMLIRGSGQHFCASPVVVTVVMGY